MEYEISFIGLLIALIFISVTGVYPGGIIVPCYLSIFIYQPFRIAVTLVIALLTFICFRVASNYLIIFGKRRFVFMILVGGCITFLWLHLSPSLLPVTQEFRTIGWVIPGLIANHFEKQGILITSGSLITVLVVIFFIRLFLNI